MIKYFSLESRINRLKVKLAYVEAKLSSTLEVQSQLRSPIYCNDIILYSGQVGSLTEKLRQLESKVDAVCLIGKSPTGSEKS